MQARFPIDVDASVALEQEIIVREDIKLVVASSLGGFTALLLRGIPTIVINPCLRPSLELPKRYEISSGELQKFRAAEKRLFDNIDRETCRLGVFSTNDELFSYREEYERHIGRTISIRDTHKISEDSIKTYVAPEVMKMKKQLVPRHFKENTYQKFLQIEKNHRYYVLDIRISNKIGRCTVACHKGRAD